MHILKCAGVALALAALGGCAQLQGLFGQPGAGNPRTDLAAAETVSQSAQDWWIANCVNAKTFSFCSDAQTVATVKGASATATASFQTATDAVEATTLDAQTVTTLVTDAINDANAFEALVATLKTKH